MTEETKTRDEGTRALAALSDLIVAVGMTRDGLAVSWTQQDPELPARHLVAACQSIDQELGDALDAARAALRRAPAPSPPIQGEASALENLADHIEGGGSSPVVPTSLREIAGRLRNPAPDPQGEPGAEEARAEVAPAPSEGDVERAMANLYSRVKRRAREGTASDATLRHSQACGFVAYVFDVHPDEVARSLSWKLRAASPSGDKP